MRNNHLLVCLGSKSSRLEQWLLIPDTLLIDVQSCLNVIDSIDNEVKFFPELIIEDILSILGQQRCKSVDLKVRVHLLGNIAGSLGLWLSYVVLSEEELTIEI